MIEINRAAVIGAGTMELGIAGQLANAGLEVLLLDIPTEGENRNAICERALERLLDKSQPGLLHEDYIQRISIGNIEDDLHLISDADWIAEAVLERLDFKKQLYKRIHEHRKTGSIVSSNTSTIPIALLVEGMPEDFQDKRNQSENPTHAQARESVAELIRPCRQASPALNCSHSTIKFPLLPAEQFRSDNK